MLFPRAQYWGPFHLISSFIIWRERSSLPSITLQMAASWPGLLIFWRAGRLCRGIWRGWIWRDWGQTMWESEGQVPGPSLWFFQLKWIYSSSLWSFWYNAYSSETHLLVFQMKQNQSFLFSIIKRILHK